MMKTSWQLTFFSYCLSGLASPPAVRRHKVVASVTATWIPRGLAITNVSWAVR